MEVAFEDVNWYLIILRDSTLSNGRYLIFLWFTLINAMLGGLIYFNQDDQSLAQSLINWHTRHTLCQRCKNNFCATCWQNHDTTDQQIHL